MFAFPEGKKVWIISYPLMIAHDQRERISQQQAILIHSGFHFQVHGRGHLCSCSQLTERTLNAAILLGLQASILWTSQPPCTSLGIIQFLVIQALSLFLSIGYDFKQTALELNPEFPDEYFSKLWDFPGGPMVRTPRFHSQGRGFNPCLGN